MSEGSAEESKPNFFAMRNRQSLLESGLATGAPPPAIMYKPGSADENAGGFVRALKRLASSWKKRKVIVNPAMLQYEDLESGKVVGALRVSDISAAKVINRAVMKTHGSPDNLIDNGWLLVAGGRQYVFACETAAVRDAWVGYLGGIVKQRAEDNDGDDATNLGYAQTRIARSSFDPNHAGESLFEPTAAAMEANSRVFDSIRVQQSHKYRKSDDGEEGSGDREDPLEFEEEEESADSEMVVERGDEVVTATLENQGDSNTTTAKKGSKHHHFHPSELIRVPGPNATYRKENIVIEALFEDLRTTEPDHVRLAQVETPAATLSYYVPHLLRAAQDNELPCDQPAKPVFVSEYCRHASSHEPPLRHSCIAPSRIPALVNHMNHRMDLGARLPNYRGVSHVVDSDGLIVGGPQALLQNAPVYRRQTQYELAKTVQLRHIAAKIFSFAEKARILNLKNNAAMATAATSSSFTGQGQGGKQQQQMMMMHQQSSSSNSQLPPPVPQITTSQHQHQQQQHQQEAEVVGGMRPKSLSAMYQQQSLLGGTNSSKPSSPSKNVSFGGANQIVENQQFNKNATPTSKSAPGMFPHAPSLEDTTGGTSGGGLTADASFLGRINQSISALRHRSNMSVATQSQAGGPGQQQHQGADSVYGPVVTVETTKRRIVISDLAYKSDTCSENVADVPPPLYLVSILDTS